MITSTLVHTGILTSDCHEIQMVSSVFDVLPELDNIFYRILMVIPMCQGSITLNEET